jgi:hypothetical protein
MLGGTIICFWVEVYFWIVVLFLMACHMVFHVDTVLTPGGNLAVLPGGVSLGSDFHSCVTSGPAIRWRPRGGIVASDFGSRVQTVNRIVWYSLVVIE